MKNLLIAIVFVMGMLTASYFVGWGIAYVSSAVEGMFNAYPENKYR